MKVVEIEKLKPGQILDQDVINSTGVVLIPKGTILRHEYIQKMMEIGLKFASIKNKAEEELTSEQEKVIYNECVEKVKNTMETYFCSTDSKLIEMKTIAQSIIQNALKQRNVMISMNELRSKDEKRYSHSTSVASIAVLFSLKMGIERDLINDIAVGSLLHDIGYSVVNAKISNNLSNDIIIDIEKEVKMHVIYGYNMIQNEDWISDNSKDVILYHHERIDGSGYPFHRKDKQISIGSKIVGVCDEFDTLVYQNNMKVHEAVEYILSEGGRTLDFEVIKVFNEMVAAYPTGSIVLTNTDEIGIVIKQNNKCPTRPIIRIINRKDGNVSGGRIEDLTVNLTMFINDTVDI